MTDRTTFELIKEKEAQIEELLDPSTFTLNPKVVELQQDIENLRSECSHEYAVADGACSCKHCGKTIEIVLYKSLTCPQCKIAKMKLDKKNIPYIEEMNMEVFEARGIKGIPQMDIGDKRLTSIRDISKWIDSVEAK